MNTMHMKKHLPPDPRLGELLLSFRRKIMEACRKEGLPNHLSMPQIEIISFIGPDGSATMKEIAGHLKITPPSVTTIIAEMEKKKIIERNVDPSDRRRVSIVFSKSAKTMYSSISKKKKEVLDAMLSRLSVNDKKELERIITILIKE
jgi:DNA-binding MarR family transcriptional regulator